LKTGELEQQDINVLAMYCVRVAESAAANSLQAEQARQFKAEWGWFVHRAYSSGHTRAGFAARYRGLWQRVEAANGELPGGESISRERASHGFRIQSEPHNRRKREGRMKKFATEIYTAVKSGRLEQPLNATMLRDACPGWVTRTYSVFPAKQHTVGNGKTTELFVRVGRGLYRIKE
jgi:hypothetical protein